MVSYLQCNYWEHSGDNHLTFKTHGLPPKFIHPSVSPLTLSKVVWLAKLANSFSVRKQQLKAILSERPLILHGSWKGMSDIVILQVRFYSPQKGKL